MTWIVPLPLGPLWLLAVTFPAVLVAYGARVALLGRATDPRVQRERPTPLLGTFPMEAMHWALRGAGAIVDAAGIFVVFQCDQIASSVGEIIRNDSTDVLELWILSDIRVDIDGESR